MPQLADAVTLAMEPPQSAPRSQGAAPPPLSTAGDGQVLGGRAALTLGALGVVYGDIGTSPLYALREAMLASGASPGAVPHENILGVISLILWTLMLIVSGKYVLILLRADNQGEGGTLSLLALVQRATKTRRRTFLVLGILGAALFSGDALITPAVSVLSAVEGITLITSTADGVIEAVAVAIIIGLFAIQRHGTELVARWFGPILALWFVVLAAGGLWRVSQDPAVLAAISPLMAGRFLSAHTDVALVVLGSVFLAVTGAEALYADMGHFGAGPIQRGWFVIALPALVLNYLGQGALLMTQPDALVNPFFLLFPDWALVPMVLLAMAATIIASQAVITGAYSLAQQAIQLKLLPRMRIRHTSEAQQGQIYIPVVNSMLLAGVLTLVLTFGSSSALAAAYGISVSGAMLVTSILAVAVLRLHWRWRRSTILLVMGPFLLLELVFFASNLMKVADGGYVPLGIAAVLLVVMLIWQRGTAIVARKDQEGQIPLASLIAQTETSSHIAAIPGTAVFLTTNAGLAPVALLHSLKHFRALHAQNILLSIVTRHSPRVADADRIEIEEISPAFRRIKLSYGYAEDPDVPRALMLLRQGGLKFDIMATSFILSRRNLRPSIRSEMPMWQARIFIYLSRNAARPQDYFRIPAGRVVEIGTQMNL